MFAGWRCKEKVYRPEIDLRLALKFSFKIFKKEKKILLLRKSPKGEWKIRKREIGGVGFHFLSSSFIGCKCYILLQFPNEWNLFSIISYHSMAFLSISQDTFYILFKERIKFVFYFCSQP